MSLGGLKIPGYGGYVPRLGPENVVGHTFTVSQKLADVDSYQDRASTTHTRSRSEWASAVDANRGEHLAKRCYGGSIGSIQTLRSRAPQQPRRILRKRLPSPARLEGLSRSVYTAPQAGYNSDGDDQWRPIAGQQGQTFSSSCNLSGSNWRPSAVPVLKRRDRISGYAGYVPGIASSNVFGQVFAEAQHLAPTQWIAEPEPVQPRLPRRRNSSPLRADHFVSGYGGYIPRVGPSNIYGKTFQAAQDAAGISINLDSPYHTHVRTMAA